MSGNANSGRPKLYEEFHKINAINKLWQKVERKITEGEELTEWEKTLVAPLLSRTIKTQSDITSGDKPLPLLNYALLNNNSNTQDNGDGQEDKNLSGGDVSQQINIDSLIPDTPSTERQEPDTD